MCDTDTGSDADGESVADSFGQSESVTDLRTRLQPELRRCDGTCPACRLGGRIEYDADAASDAGQYADTCRITVGNNDGWAG